MSAVYTFLSWVRQGLSGAGLPSDTPFANPSLLPASAAVSVSLKISENDPIPKNVRIAGPADVIGIDPRQVVRCDPAPFARGFEPEFLAAVEFDRPDFPWMFTPASANGESQLRPWLCLIVLKKGEGIELRSGSGNQAPVVEIRAPHELPDLKESWGWAHAQVSGDLTGPNALDAIVSGSPEKTISRLVCPQRLAPDTNYIACVVPTFEAGRLAGLGLPLTDNAKVLNPAWRIESEQLEQGLLLPVYYSWEFSTGPAGNFQSLVEKLRPGLSRGLGVREMVVDGQVRSFEGVLRGKEAEPQPWDSEAAKVYRAKLRKLVNELSLVHNELVLAPPLYAATYAGTAKIPEDNAPSAWLRELNLDPGYRAIAALGTSVIQAQQETLMASAWEQAGEIERAHAILINAQLLRAASGSIYQNHLSRLPPSSFLEVTRPLHGRVLFQPATTIEHAIAGSNTPVAVTTSAFRRVTRPRGPILRRVLPPDQRTVRPFVAQMAVGKMAFSANAQGEGNFSHLGNTASTNFPMSAILDPTPEGGIDLSHIDIVTIDLVEALYKNSGGTHVPNFAPVNSERITNVPISNEPWRSSFRITRAHLPNNPSPEAPPSAAPGLPHDSAAASLFRAAVAAHQQLLGQPDWTEPPVKDQLPLEGFSRDVLKKLDPAETVPNLVRPLIKSADQASDGPLVSDDLQLMKIAPQFPQPMYEGLRDLSQELLLPGIESVEEDTALLLQTNPRFIEAYMAGLNHEMGREFQWRGYPAHHLNTPFRYFWDTRGQKGGPSPEIPPIEEWKSSTELGDNVSNSMTPPLALLIRGELMRRYPTAIVCAVPAVWLGGKIHLGDIETYPLFQASLNPDVKVFGFPISEDEALGNETLASLGYFFVIQEHPTEPRFGVEANDPGTGNLQPQGDAAQTAGKLLRRPVRVAIHALDLLKDE